MRILRYNGMEFELEACGEAWTVLRRQPEGPAAVVGARLFSGLTREAAEARALALVRAVHPCGVRLVGPDLGHSHVTGAVRIVPPDVGHASFVGWPSEDGSFS